MKAAHRISQQDGTWEDVASMHYGARHSRTPREIHFRSTSGPFSSTADHLVPLSLLTGMVNNETVEIDGNVSPRLLANVPRIVEILRAFCHTQHQELPEIEVKAQSSTPQQLPEGRGAASFFSGGVDSLYGALTLREELSALIFIHGFDLDVRDEEWRKAAAGRARMSAAAVGLPLIEIETDQSSLIGRAAVWPVAYGTALASVALLLQPLFSRIYIPGGRALTRLLPSGAHPMLDHLWSTESTSIVHGAREVERWQKIQYLADSPIAQKNLRICFERESAPYNCGECPKCLTTMATLSALGALDRFDVFARPLNANAIANLDVSVVSTRIRIEDTLAIIDAPGAPPNEELRDALITSLERWVASLSERQKKPNFQRGSWRARLWPERTESFTTGGTLETSTSSTEGNQA